LLKEGSGREEANTCTSYKAVQHASASSSAAGHGSLLHIAAERPDRSRGMSIMLMMRIMLRPVIL
jgi:hypothetical protein